MEHYRIYLSVCIGHHENILYLTPILYSITGGLQGVYYVSYFGEKTQIMGTG